MRTLSVSLLYLVFGHLIVDPESVPSLLIRQCLFAINLAESPLNQGMHFIPKALPLLELVIPAGVQTEKYNVMDKHARVNCIDFIEFPAEDVGGLNKAKDFYTNVFNWSYQDWGADYSDTQSSGLSSGINADPSHRPSTPLAVIYTLDLEVVREKVIELDGVITREIFSFPGGRRFHFKDPAGNELAVWSDK